MLMGDFKQLIVWNKAMRLTKLAYSLTAQLPTVEAFGLKSQIQRSAVSIPSNIAEGSKRGTKRDFVQFLRIAHGSLAELETQIYLVEEVYPGVLVQDQKGLIQEVGRMLFTLIRKLS